VSVEQMADACCLTADEKDEEADDAGGRSFFSGRSPAYSGLQRAGRQQAQCACPWERGGELVGVCSVCDMQERQDK